jgi:hypothetical protein
LIEYSTLAELKQINSVLAFNRSDYTIYDVSLNLALTTPDNQEESASSETSKTTTSKNNLDNNQH